ncbi:WD repeat, SAM and U-box domain-containing protein 1-like [Ctenocephalides felis]|uniref:WD repeat, SAM and U-box domain-containing protein 1-like n=1 Tax=Ctenocephalides felis TaxID=7515 RepID=UPI000E6E1357|nr:WD repeat, SAM and U-box domain-containing protein 1-like [Ctenocephalides felis]
MSVKLLQSLKGHNSDVTCVIFMEEAHSILVPAIKTVRVWKWQIGEGFQEDEHSPFLGHKYGVTCVRISKKGDLLASSSVDGTTILWCTRSGSRRQMLVQDTGEPVRSCAFSRTAQC